MSTPERKEPTINEENLKEEGKKTESLIGDTVTPPAADGATAVAPETANDNKAEEAKAEAPASAPAAKTYGRGRKALSVAFNVAVGAGLTGLTKVGVAAGAAALSVPALGVLVASAVAVGAVATVWCHFSQNRALAKEGKEKLKFFSKKNAKVFGVSAGFAAVGGALFLAFEDQFKAAFNWAAILVSGKQEAAAVAAVAPVVPVETVAAPPVEVVAAAVPTAADRIADLVNAGNVSAEVKAALARSLSDNAAVAAQGTKDLGYYAFNGFGGLAKDQTLAVELFTKAAEAGNVQAKVDLAYAKFYGFGTAADQTSAINAVSELNTAKAEAFEKAWKATAKAVAPAVSAAAPSV